MERQSLTVKEAILEALEGLSEQEQIFVMEMLHDINNGLVTKLRYDSTSIDNENVKMQRTLTFF